MKIYPMPYKYDEKDEFFVFSGKLTVKYNEDFPKERTLTLLAELWSNFTGAMTEIEFVRDASLLPHTISAGGVTAVCPDEFEHAISVTTAGFGAAAKEYKGLIHAFCTLLQIIQPERIDNEDFKKFHMSCCDVFDKPSMAFRCFHISFLPGMFTTVQQTIRMCGLMKYSHILIEFFGTMEFDCLKELSYKGAYKKDQIRPLIEEAQALGLELVPMFNHLGHAASADNSTGVHVVLNQAPHMAALFEPDGWTFCLSNPQTKALLKSIRRELIELCGDGKFFHMGGDEAHSLGTCDVCRKTPPEKLYADYVNEVAEEMKAEGRRVIIWGETMLEHDRWRYHTDSFGHKYEASEGTPPTAYKALDMLDKSVIINDWQYEIWDDNVITSEYLKQKGFDVITASATEVKNTDALCKAVRKHGYFGHMQTVWSKKFLPILITRGGTSSWSENIDAIDKLERGEHNFVRQYMLMGHRSGDLLRKVLPEAELEFSVV